MKVVSDPYKVSIGTFLEDTTVTVEYDLVTDLKTIHFYNFKIPYFNFFISEQNFSTTLNDFRNILDVLEKIDKQVTINDGTS